MPDQVQLAAFSLSINGTAREVAVEPRHTLLDLLRDTLMLTGTKRVCDMGNCGACTVLVDGQPVRSCIVRVGAVTDKTITTIEGLETDGQLHPLQQAFLDVGAMQCAYCTSGMIMAGVGLLTKNPEPSDQEIVRAMDGNICRCGTYPRIVTAIRRAAAAMRGGDR
jgi:aerobic-type carbon monoxide dehydrogenase small subunit (CoxS/CutS family)